MREDRYPEYGDIVIDVYDIAAFVASETDGEYETFDFSEGAAILLQNDGSGCILDYEAVGWEFKNIDEETDIGINPILEQDKEGYTKIYVVPTYRLTCTYREIIEGAPVKQMTVNEFFTKRNYNSRCASNFAEIVPFLKDMM